MAQRLIAIGDIHGCRTALKTLLEAIDPQRDDLLVFLGDIVDRGPDSKGVIDDLIELGGRTQLVGILGNHEEMMLEVLRHGGDHHTWLRCGGVETLESYGFDGNLDFLSAEHNAFLDSLGDYFQADEFFFTHAAYEPDVPLDAQDVDRLRWYSLTAGIPGPHQSGLTAVVGHTANRSGEIVDVGHLICLDTYCYGGGWLTAMEMKTRTVWQANQRGELRQNG
ncbi:serine/threonine protein phosphatase [Roseiconus nitratireducens]|uniref:Serine/threonine protein phosphatase n=1 Tax=Roseiconus nitratireducens TaxID=2605748 RepID=A0A5M6D267_9BACT|nr:metallophosphoesterase family protein [Roseiconus nitratireducens]KAA5541433.1 serine/threonine protein phosphatase [Roseiconus nitratireducens]